MAAEMAAPPVPYPMLIPCRTEQVNDQAAEFGARSFPALPHLWTMPSSVHWALLMAAGTAVLAGEACCVQHSHVQVRYVPESRRAGNHIQV